MVSRKLIVLGILLILAGVLFSGCLCCCSSPDYGTYSPPHIPKIRATPTTIVKPSVTIVPVVVPVPTSASSPNINVTVRPNAT